MPLIQPLPPAWTHTPSPDLSLHLDTHTGMAELCHCPVSLVHFQLLLLETLPPSLKLLYSTVHITETQGHHNLHLQQLAEVPHQPRSSRPCHLSISPCHLLGASLSPSETRHQTSKLLSSSPKVTLCPQFSKALEANPAPSQQPRCTDSNRSRQALRYTSHTLLWGSLLLFYPGSQSHSLSPHCAFLCPLLPCDVLSCAVTPPGSDLVIALGLQSLVSLAGADSTQGWGRALLLGQGSHCCQLLPAPLAASLTCWDSLAAAAASPVSMEATLVPSRTGRSCRGTEGPTRAAREQRQ